MKKRAGNKRRGAVRTTAVALLAAAAVSVVGTAAAPASSMEVQAAWSSGVTGDDTRWVTQSSLMTVMQASLLNPLTDANGIYLQLQQGILYKTFSEADILMLVQEGYEIPAESLERLYTEGWISGYLYKAATNQGFTAEDFADVFDADYYVSANPAIAQAVASGQLPNDEETLFLNWLYCGVSAGLDASEDFSFAYFEAEYPVICEELSYNKLAEVEYYILLKDEYVLRGNG